MVKNTRAESSITKILLILRAWTDGKITITQGSDDIQNSVYSLNTIISVIERIALEGITPPTELIAKGEVQYEIFNPISEV